MDDEITQSGPRAWERRGSEPIRTLEVWHDTGGWWLRVDCTEWVDGETDVRLEAAVSLALRPYPHHRDDREIWRLSAQVDPTLVLRAVAAAIDPIADEVLEKTVTVEAAMRGPAGDQLLTRLPELEALVLRGVELAWSGAFPVLALQALWSRGDRSGVGRLLAPLSPLERVSRAGWISASLPAREIECERSGESAVCGYLAGARGGDFERLLAGLTPSAQALAIAAGHLGGLTLSEDMRQTLAATPLPAPDDVTLTPDERAVRLAVAIAGADAAEIARELDALVAEARQSAHDFASALVKDETAERVAAAHAFVARAQPAELDRRSYLRLLRHARVLSRAGAGAEISALIERLERAWGAPEQWPHPGSFASELMYLGDRWYPSPDELLPLRLDALAMAIRQGRPPLFSISSIAAPIGLVTEVALPRPFLDDALGDVVFAHGMTCEALLRLNDCITLARPHPSWRERLGARAREAAEALARTVAELIGSDVRPPSLEDPGAWLSEARELASRGQP